MSFDRISEKEVKTDTQADAEKLKRVLKNLRDGETLWIAFEEFPGQTGRGGGTDGREEHIGF